MAGRITAPELEQFIVATVELTGRVLGAGAYGSVEEVDIPGANVAAKKLHPQLVNLGSPQQVEKWVTDFVEECKLMSQLRHPHIVQFLGVCYLPGSQLPVLLMEKLQTSLDSILETSSNIPIDLKVHLLTGTGRGMVYLHSRTPPIAHRDLTARNILVDNSLNAKIADMGVSKIVNIQPGQLAATMTQAPGNILYMPPEAAQEEGAARYNTAIDIFSFGVVSLFTLTQTFPKDLKPATYHDPVVKRIVGRSEIERRENYIVPMKAALGDTHPLVQLTLDCLEYVPEDRPSATVVLRRLEEVGTTLPQNCTQSKLELVQQNSTLQDVNDHLTRQSAAKEGERKQKNQAQIQIIEQLQSTNDHLVSETKEQAQLINALQKQLRVRYKETQASKATTPKETIQQCDKAVNKLETPPVLPPRHKGSPKLAVSTLVWKKCKNSPQVVSTRLVANNNKLYTIGKIGDSQALHEYAPDQDEWIALLSPPIEKFTIATLQGKLLAVPVIDTSCTEAEASIFKLVEYHNEELSFKRHQWILSDFTLPQLATQSHPAVVEYSNYLIATQSHPAVVEYSNYLIVACGQTDDPFAIHASVEDILRRPGIDSHSELWILHATNNTWISTTCPILGSNFNTMLIVGNHLYVVGTDREVFKAHVPSLISRSVSHGKRMWEKITSIPSFLSSLVAVGNSLLAVGGAKDDEFGWGGIPATSIHSYDPAMKRWTKSGILPEKIYHYSCIKLSGKLYVFGLASDAQTTVMYSAEYP